MTPFSVHTREEFLYINPRLYPKLASNMQPTHDRLRSRPCPHGATQVHSFFPGTKEVFRASMTSWASPGTTQRIVGFRSGQHWATAAMAWVIGTHLRDGCKWIVSSPRGYPQIIQVMDDHAKIILDHFSIETHGDLGIHLKKTPISKREHFRFRERSCSASDAERVQPEVVLGSSRNMFVASGLSVNYPQNNGGQQGK